MQQQLVCPVSVYNRGRTSVSRSEARRLKMSSGGLEGAAAVPPTPCPASIAYERIKMCLMPLSLVIFCRVYRRRNTNGQR